MVDPAAQSSAPETPPNGQALVVADPSAEPAMREALTEVGYGMTLAAEPYAAALELLRRPMGFRALVISLPSVHPEELTLIEMVRRRMPNLEVIVADAAGRPAALESAIARGAEAVLDGRRLLRFHAPAARGPRDQPARRSESPAADEAPVLSADELKALLQE